MLWAIEIKYHVNMEPTGTSFVWTHFTKISLLRHLHKILFLIWIDV